MRIEELVIKLASDARPVRVLAPVGRRLAGWFVVAIAAVGLGVVVPGPRADLAVRLADPGFLAVLSILVLFALSSAAGALAMSVPNDRRSRLTLALPVVAGAVWAVALTTDLAGGSFLNQLRGEPLHAVCALQIVAIAIVPAVLLLSMLRAGATIARPWAGTLALAAALGAGAVGAALVCPIDSAAHQAIWHVLPVTALAATGTLIGSAVLDRLSR